MNRVRVGLLGAATITPPALIEPARSMDGVEVVAVAARDFERAKSFASLHDIPVVHQGYEDLLRDQDVDAVYIALPHSLHAPWTIAAVRAGKHVLCEKPFTTNAPDAKKVAVICADSGRVVMEAFHSHYHPVAARIQEILDSGELGRIQRIEAWICSLVKRPVFWDITLGGGAFVTSGCYGVHFLRMLARAEPQVTSAVARLHSAQVDAEMKVELSFADGRTGCVIASMSASRRRTALRVVGESGRLEVRNPFDPHRGHQITVTRETSARRERCLGQSSYWYQLQAFRDAILEGKSVLTSPEDSVANMEVIDAAYTAAGLQPR